MWTKTNMLMTVVACCVAIGVALPAAAQPPETLHFQGYLTNDSGAPLDGKWTISFGFYDVATGGTALWEETLDVDVVTGVFQALLGASVQNPVDPAIFEKGVAFLGLTLWDNGQGTDLLPRQAVVSNPYSFFASQADQCVQAQNADSLGGQGADQFVSVTQVGDLCLTNDNIEQWLVDNGYSPDGGCACQWSDLAVPDTLVYEDELKNTLANYYDITAVDAMMGNYYSMADMGALLATYATTAEVEALLAGYYTATALDALLAAYATTADVETTLAAYYTKVQINGLFDLHYTKMAVDALLAAYYTKAQVDGFIANLAAKDHDHDGVYMEEDKGAVDKSADFSLAAPTFVPNLDADTVDGKHASDFAPAGSKHSPYLESDSDWFTFPVRSSLPVTVSTTGADFLFVVARSFDQGAQVTTPIMGAVSDSYASAYSAFDGKTATLRVETDIAAINTVGDYHNLQIDSGLGRMFAFKKTPDFSTGWQSCAADNTYVHQHNLGSLPTIAYLEVASNANGGGWRTATMTASNHTGVGWRQAAIVQMDAAKVTFRVQGRLCEMRDVAGASVSPTSGFCRAQLWTLAPDYDSGWTAISTSTGNRDKWFRHNFHQFPSLVMVYVAQNATGTGWLVPAMGAYHESYTNGTGVYDINDSWITVKGGSANVADFVDANGATQSPTSGYVRVLAWK